MSNFCKWCGRPIPESKNNRPRYYCYSACNQAMYRARKRKAQLIKKADEILELIKHVKPM